MIENPLLTVDSYKTFHDYFLVPGTTKIYSNLTPRASRDAEIKEIVFFGLQYFLQEYLTTRMQKGFFDRDIEEVVEEFEKYTAFDTDKIRQLHELGFLPIEIKALPEGTKVPLRVPVLTITNTHEDFYWLTNYIETLMSCVLWLPSTSATTLNQYRKVAEKAWDRVGGDNGFINIQFHDFSCRGLNSSESSMVAGMAHFVNFDASDTVPAFYAIDKYYNASFPTNKIFASEHACMSTGTKILGSEFDYYKYLVTEAFPSGLLALVSDTYDYWRVLTEYMPKLKNEILNRTPDENGLVSCAIRGDSGDPVKIIVGDPDADPNSPEYKGTIELLWDTFGGEIDENGFKRLNPKVGAVYGEAISLDRCDRILNGLIDKGFYPNVFLGLGSWNHCKTRDEFGWAVKCTYVEHENCGYNVYKDPITDDGTKKSAKGLLKVERVNGQLTLKDQVSQEEEQQGELKTVFKNGVIVNKITLDQIRNNMRN